MRQVYLMSYPGPDWHIRGAVNFRSRSQESTHPRMALREWMRLADAITEAGGEVVVMPPPDEQPAHTGLIYAANHGALFPSEGAPTFLISKMHASHRQGEQAPIRDFFTDGLGLETLTADRVWEGQADITRLSDDRAILTYGVRSEEEACAMVRAQLPEAIDTLELELRDPFFHGDTCLSPLHGRGGRGLLLVHPGAFTDDAPSELARFAPDVELIEISQIDALAYACNALQVRGTLIAPAGLSMGLLNTLSDRGLHIQELELAELFGKGGGGPRCLVNVLRGLDPDTIPHDLHYPHQREAIAARLEGYPELD